MVDKGIYDSFVVSHLFTISSVEWKHRKQGNNARPNVLPTNQREHENQGSLCRDHNGGSNTQPAQALGANGDDECSATFYLRDDFNVNVVNPARLVSFSRVVWGFIPDQRLIPRDVEQHPTTTGRLRVNNHATTIGDVLDECSDHSPSFPL
tara:strand:+ start:138 stop:590 length:453 start_codon:yes stop_codon:yes gene_type:complete